MTFKEYQCNIYGAKVWFISGCTHLQCKKKLESKLNAEIDNWDHENSEGFTEIYSDPTVFVVWINDKKDIYTLLHEVVHLAIEILNDRGVKISESENGEVLAYYVEYWFKTLTNKKKNDK